MTIYATMDQGGLVPMSTDEALAFVIIIGVLLGCLIVSAAYWAVTDHEWGIVCALVLAAFVAYKGLSWVYTSNNELLQGDGVCAKLVDEFNAAGYTTDVKLPDGATLTNGGIRYSNGEYRLTLYARDPNGVLVDDVIDIPIDQKFTGLRYDTEFTTEAPAKEGLQV